MAIWKSEICAAATAYAIFFVSVGRVKTFECTGQGFSDFHYYNYLERFLAVKSTLEKYYTK